MSWRSRGKSSQHSAKAAIGKWQLAKLLFEIPNPLVHTVAHSKIIAGEGYLLSQGCPGSGEEIGF
jgi:hypothetical protein